MRPLLTGSGVVALLVLLAAGCGGGTGGGHSTSTATQATRSQGSSPVIHPPVQSIRAGDNPHNLAIAGGRIWVADFGGPVREFSMRGRQLRTIKLDAQSMAAGPDGLWVSLLSNSNTGPQGPLAEVDLGGAAVSRRLATRDSVDVLAVGGGAVWTASHFAPRITRIPLSGGPQRTFRLPGTPTAIALGSGAVWVAFGQAGTPQAVGEPETGGGGVVKLDARSGQQLSTQTEQAVPTALLVAKGSVWVALANDLDELDRLDEATGQSASSTPISVGKQPTDLAFGDGSVWVLNYSDATITRVDPSTGQPTRTIAFGPPTDPDRLAANTPIRLAVTPRTLWVTDAQANTLSRIPAG